LQCVVVDASSPCGIATSNALQALVP
jgi:hypothetical protein